MYFNSFVDQETIGTMGQENGLIRCAPRELKLCAGKFNPISLEELLQKGWPKTEWILEGYIPQGGLVLFSGHPKSGKSTLASFLVTAITKGETIIGCQTHSVPILWLGLEERMQDIGNRFKNLGASRSLSN